MNEREQDLERARERLLDASLSEVFGRRADAAQPPAQARAGWLRAAIVLLGVGVVALSWWWAGDSAPQEAGGLEAEVQDPAPIPKPRACSSAEQMLAMDVDVASLLLMLEDPGDLVHVERFQALRQLIVLNPLGGGDAWQQLGERPDALRAIGRLARLETLQLPQDMQVTPDHLRSLSGARQLRMLTLPRNTPTDAEAAAALVALPGLRELRLNHAPIAAGFLAALAPRGLTALELNGCAVASPDVYAELARLPSVRRLAVRYMTGMSKRTPEIGEQAFAAFEQMPNLVDLDLDETAFADRYMKRLPRRLQRLRLGYHVMTPSTIADLKRLADLEELIFHHARHYEPVVDLLGALRLKTVFLHGWLDERVLAAIASHPSIERVTLRLRGRVGLEPLRRARSLKALQIRFDPNVPAVGEPAEELLQALRENGVEVSIDRQN